MAQKKQVPEATILLAKYKIFNQLCIAYRRSRQDPDLLLRADELSKKLALPEDVFAKALEIILNDDNQSAIEVIKNGGQLFLRLGESARYNCSD